MKKHNFSILVASLLSTIALVACNSGSSSSGSNPTPTVSPSTNPTIAPTTVPPIVVGESSIATINQSSPFAISSMFSTAPSQGVWYQYYSSLNAQGSNPTPTNISTMTQTTAGLVIANANTTGANVFYSADGSQFTPVKTAGGSSLIQNNVTGVVAGTTNAVIYSATGSNIRLLDNAGVASDLLPASNFVLSDGSTVASQLPAIAGGIKYFGDKYYLFTTATTAATDNNVYVSTDGSHWTGLAANTIAAGVVPANVVQVGSSYFTLATTALPVTAGKLLKSTTSPVTGYAATSVFKDTDGSTDIAGTFTALLSNGKVLYAGTSADKNLYFLGNGNVASAIAKGTEPTSAATAGTILIIDGAGTAYDTLNNTYLTISGTSVVSNVIDSATDNITSLADGTVVNGLYNNQLITAKNGNGTTVTPYLKYVTSVAASSGTANLALNATPAYTSIADFTAVGKEYIVMARNGFTVMTSNNAFVPIQSVPLVINTTYPNTVVSSSVSNGSSIVAIGRNSSFNDMPYLYVSSGVGTNLTWTAVSTGTNKVIADVAVGINGLYLITTTNDQKYITSTPASLATWVSVSDFNQYAVPSSTTAINGYNYTTIGTDVEAVATATSIITNYVGVLPVSGDLPNVWLYNGTNFYISQYNSANLWMSASFTGGTAGWGSPTVAKFTSKGNPVSGEKFSTQFKWTGKTFVTTGLSSNQVYTSTTGATWPAQYTAGGVAVTATTLNQY